MDSLTEAKDTRNCFTLLSVLFLPGIMPMEPHRGKQSEKYKTKSLHSD